MSQLNQKAKQASSTEEVRTLDQSAMELSCIDLILQLEHMLATAKESDRGDQVEESAKLANKMLEKLITFSDEHLAGANEEILEEIGRAARSVAIHKEVLSKRSWGSTIMSMFIIDAIDENSKKSHKQLGNDLARACGTTLQYAIQLFGEDSVIGQQIGQSTTVFVNEFEAVW